MNNVLKTGATALAIAICMFIGGQAVAKDPDAGDKTVAGAHNGAQDFEWAKDSRLCWDDFKGAIPRNTNDNVAAATYCGIGFETNTVTDNDKPKITVYNTFYTNQSWVRPEERTPEILQHEQGHFDICELYTRIMKQKMSEASLNAHNLRTMLEQIYQTVNDQYEQCQQQYEDETGHGTITDAQNQWTQKIAAQLNDTEKWNAIAAVYSR